MKHSAQYKPEIDGLRAVAVLAVLANHLVGGLFPGGFLGVDIFFVISGYVITLSLFAREQQPFGEFLLAFYSRRFKRLIPALLVCILVCSLVYSLFVQVPASSLWTGFAGIFGFSNIFLYLNQADYFAQATELNLFLHTWSLGVEEQFYLLYPVIFWLASRRQQLFKRLLVLVLLLGILSAVLFRLRVISVPPFLLAQGKAPYFIFLILLVALALFIRKSSLFRPYYRPLFLLLAVLSAVSILCFSLLINADPSAAFYLMPNRFWEMGLGCLLALMANRFLASADHLGERTSRFSGVSAGLLAMICIFFFLPYSWKGITTPAVTGLTALLLASMNLQSADYDIGKRLLSSSGMTFIGLISYSLYLWHWPVLVIARWTIGAEGWSLLWVLGVTIVLSLISYRFIEAPLRRAQWGASNAATIGYGFGAQLALAGSLYSLLSMPTNWLYAARANKTSFNLEGLSVAGTEMTLTTCGSPAKRDTCVLEPRQGRPLLVLLGDSHAGHLYPAMGEVIKRTGLGLASFNTAGNAHQPFPVISFGGGQKNNQYLSRLPEKAREINSFYRTISLRMQRGDVVVLASDLFRYFNPFFPNTDPRFLAWRRAIATLSTDLSMKGVNVVVVAPSPHFESGGGPNCQRQWFRPELPSKCYATLSLETVQEKRGKMVDALRSLAANHPNLFVYDPLFIFCSKDTGVCSNNNKEKVFYLDGDHLSPDSASAVGADFVNFLHKTSLIR